MLAVLSLVLLTRCTSTSAPSDETVSASFSIQDSDLLASSTGGQGRRMALDVRAQAFALSTDYIYQASLSGTRVWSWSGYNNIQALAWQRAKQRMVVMGTDNTTCTVSVSEPGQAHQPLSTGAMTWSPVWSSYVASCSASIAVDEQGCIWDANFNGHGRLACVNDETGSATVLIRATRTWAQAGALCDSLGDGLVTVNDAQEEAFLRRFDRGSFWWLGFNDVQSEGRFVWRDGPSAYTHWASGQPDDAGGEDCAVANFTASHQWNDLPCSAAAFIVCESLD